MAEDHVAEEGACEQLLTNANAAVVTITKSVDDSHAQLVLDDPKVITDPASSKVRHGNIHKHLFRTRSSTVDSKKADGSRASKKAIRIILLFTTVLFALSVGLIAVTLNMSSFIDLAVHEQLSTLLQQQQQQQLLAQYNSSVPSEQHTARANAAYQR